MVNPKGREMFYHHTLQEGTVFTGYWKSSPNSFASILLQPNHKYDLDIFFFTQNSRIMVISGFEELARKGHQRGLSLRTVWQSLLAPSCPPPPPQRFSALDQCVFLLFFFTLKTIVIIRVLHNLCVRVVQFYIFFNLMFNKFHKLIMTQEML